MTFTGTASEQRSFTVAITDDAVNEAAETFTVALSSLGATVPVAITDTATVTIIDNETAAVTIGDVSVAEDAGTVTVTATLSAAVQDGFTVQANTSDGTATAGSDYTAVSAHTLTFAGTADEQQSFTVTITDDAIDEADETFTVALSSLGDNNDVPVAIADTGTVTITDDDTSLGITGLANAAVDENAAWGPVTPTLTGMPVGTVTWTLEGDDAGDFAIDPDTGALSMAARDFEDPTDQNGDNAYEVTVIATDAGGNTAMVSITVTVADVDESPDRQQQRSARSLAYEGRFTEHSANDGRVHGTIVINLAGDTFTAGVVKGSHVSASNVPAGLTASFTRTSDTVVALALTGSATSHANADDVSDLTVAFADGAFTGGTAAEVTGSTRSDLAIDFDDPRRPPPPPPPPPPPQNWPPAFGEPGYRFALAENRDGSTTPVTVGTVTATDADGDPVRYALVAGDDAATFAVHSATGELSYTGGGENYESFPDPANAFTLTVRATDGTAAADVTVTVAVTDVDEPPVFGRDGYTFELAENQAGPLVLGGVTATDEDGDPVRYALVAGDDAATFAIHSATGELSYTGGGEDYESFPDPANALTLTVRATGGAAAADATVTVAVTDVDEPPGAPDAPTFGTVTRTSLVVNWQAPANTGPPITDYDVQYREVGADSFTDANYDGTDTTTTLTGLRPATSYEVQVRARNAEGTGAWSASATATTDGPERAAQAWLARFGRAVAGHVMEAIDGRMVDGAAAGSEATVAGRRVDFAAGGPQAAAATRDAVGFGDECEDRGLFGFESAAAAAAAGCPRWRSVSELELVAGSSFRLAAAADVTAAAQGGAGDGGTWTVWGRGAGSRFVGREGRVSVEGDVVTAMVAVDWAGERLLAGMAISHSTGDGTFYTLESASAEAVRDDAAASLTMLSPYLRYQVHERVAVWGVAGYGRGGMDLDTAELAPAGTDVEMKMGAAGARGALIEPGAGGGFGLALETDLMALRMDTRRSAALAAVRADANRLRLMLAGRYEHRFATGAALTPSLEVGMRRDGGHAETGAGLDLGGGLRFADPALGLTVELSGRALVAHAVEGYREWGAAGSVSLAPGAGGRGLSLAVAPSWGTAEGGAQRLWTGEPGALARAAGEPAGRVEAEVGYGLPVAGGGFTGTPHAGVALSEGARDYTLGWRLTPAPGAAGFEIGVLATRREAAAGDAAAAHEVTLRGSLRW